MRVLITLLPATGSLDPLVPLAGALADAGHEITFCSSAGFRPCVEAAGFTHLDAGLDYVFSEPGYLEVLSSAAGGVALPPPAGVDRLAWVTDKLFIGGAARRMFPDVRAAAREWGADLVLRESLEFAGCVAAEALGLPHASVAAPSNGGLDLRDQLVAPLNLLRDDAGLPPDPQCAMPYRHLHLVSTPPQFDGPAARFPSTARFVRNRCGSGWPSARAATRRRSVRCRRPCTWRPICRCGHCWSGPRSW